MFGFAMEGSGRTFTPITATILLVASTLMTSLSNLTFAEEAEWLGSREQYRTPVPTRSGVLFPKIYQSQSTLDWPSGDRSGR